ncbi:Nucleoside phosphorylase domain and Uridine phosphorylase, eukaryotic family-containing protein [Strongyloides ratti]|uniref:Nucleoside phosphorylase domain and Uridine phosphorylase, eukaryotic family-containing protein n=1 Tax=Strongyloides ratti TaxID=34506 RepID=A0A090LHX4_STRRB|nr:Nucleoside phosphorylase domain and Uridine phosphorylase, eukaryotic family-containing protein [Strongyloides ratti]CEF67115.1 Nucleoside phosphorylase domain and Uridine phosphorylase, eukaryotic family-containing protein [Strongyloides ratti]
MAPSLGNDKKFDTSDIFINNQNITESSSDFLYHFGLDKNNDDIPCRFHDVKFVCCGGSSKRMGHYAKIFAKEMNYEVPIDLSKSDRYCLYKTGKVLWVNHGIGAPSLSVMLNEIIKLLHYANCKDVSFIRLGTSGGIGVEPGTVVISSGALNGELKQEYNQWIMGKKVSRPCVVDEKLQSEIIETANLINIPQCSGLTLCADDFYEGQARLDGAFCDYNSEDKFTFLKELVEKGVRNFEMESTCFTALTSRANIKAAVCCVALLNRLNGDQVILDKNTYLEYEMRPFKLVTALLKRRLASV